MAQDTVIGGRFEFRDTISGGAVQFGLCSFGKGFPNNILPVWVKPGVKVTVTGEDNLLLTWRVKSRLPEQKTAIPAADTVSDAVSAGDSLSGKTSDAAETH